MLTEQRLQEIKERARQATEGPWRLDLWDGWLVSPSAIKTVLKGVKANSLDICFIAHAREDVPALIAELERLKAQFEQIKDLHARYMGSEEVSLPSFVHDVGRITLEALEGEP